jgi:hypothetical protein
VIRLTILAFCCAVAVVVPFFSDLVALLGATTESAMVIPWHSIAQHLDSITQHRDNITQHNPYVFKICFQI